MRPLDDDSPQTAYDLVPANYVLRAVPLAAGHHRIVMEYAPPGYVYGRWISLAACVSFVAACGVWFVRARTAKPGPNSVAITRETSVEGD